ncbi:ribonuclease III [Legionella sainthelensi]|nr:ribonuclease III [Legionella sainthelensi]
MLKRNYRNICRPEKIPLPEYILTKVEGDEHNQIFYITCAVNEMKEQTFGQGSNRRKAEQLAAKAMLERLRSNNL